MVPVPIELDEAVRVELARALKRRLSARLIVLVEAAHDAEGGMGFSD
jgi:hypothetical protein